MLPGTDMIGSEPQPVEREATVPASVEEPLRTASLRRCRRSRRPIALLHDRSKHRLEPPQWAAHPEKASAD
jgi:hypothetical protein